MDEVVQGNLTVQGTVYAASVTGDGSEQELGTVFLVAQSIDPPDPPANRSVTWMSDGTGSGDDGDIMIKITNSAGSTKTTTVHDHSAL